VRGARAIVAVITATFSLIPETLSVTKSGTGAGTVTSSPAGILCGDTCSHAFLYGTALTLTAAPGGGSIFKGWSGACSGAGACSVTVKQAQSAAATFDRLPACIVSKVEGKPLATARRSIVRAHCRTGGVTRSYSWVTKGHVISQKPPPKRHLSNGSRINLVTSKGRRR
jgi:hypothetical protein